MTVTVTVRYIIHDSDSDSAIIFVQEIHDSDSDSAIIFVHFKYIGQSL